jgi:hypothetical protein
MVDPTVVEVGALIDVVLVFEVGALVNIGAVLVNEAF